MQRERQSIRKVPARQVILAVLHRPIVCVPVVIAHKAEHGILHVVRMVITTTIAAVNGGRTVRLSLSLSVHHGDSIPQVTVGVNIFFASIFSSDFQGLQSIDLVPSPHFFS